MPTLLQINTVVNYGSTGKIAEEIGEVSIKNGWKSYIAFGRNERTSKSNLIKIGNKFGINLHVLKTRIFDRHGYGSKRDTISLIDRIKEIKPDIIHLHNIHGYYLNIDVLFAYLSESNVPVIWTLHDCWPFTGHCSYFDFVDCNKWEKECFSCPQKKEYPASLFIDNSKRNFKDKQKIFNSAQNLTLVPVSNWLGDLVKKSFLKKHQLITINNGVNLDKFYPKKNSEFIKKRYGVGDRFMLLGVAASWEPRKGFQDFIKLSRLIDENSIIILVGLNEKQIKVLPDNIIGISRTENVSDLVDLYSSADLFLNLTYEDNFPTTNIEALSCGTPVLTYNTGGSIESISLETGYIVEKGDFEGILKSIRLSNEKDRLELSELCRKRAESLYNKNDKYQEYIHLYNGLLSKGLDE